MVVDICILRPIWDVRAENIFSDDGNDDMFRLPAGHFVVRYFFLFKYSRSRAVLLPSQTNICLIDVSVYRART